MKHRFVNVKLVVMAIAGFVCFFFVSSGAFTVVEYGYLLAVYGSEAVVHEHLHIVSSKPVLLISNGDRAPKEISFCLFVVAAPLALALLIVSLLAIRRITGALGREVAIWEEFNRVQEGHDWPNRGSGLHHQWRWVVATLTMFGIVVVILKSAAADSLFTWVRNYVFILLGFSVVLRLIFIGSPQPPARPVPQATSMKKRFVWPI